MDYLCLMCNGLINLSIPCKFCGALMQELGLMQDFYDNYSPYLDQEIYQDNYRLYNAHYCVHLMRCSDCGCEQYYVSQRKLY